MLNIEPDVIRPGQVWRTEYTIKAYWGARRAEESVDVTIMILECCDVSKQVYDRQWDVVVLRRSDAPERTGTRDCYYEMSLRNWELISDV